MAQFLPTEFLGLPTLGLIISDILSTILQILLPILLQISWIFQNTPNFCNLMVLKGVMDKNPQKSEIRKYAILTQPRNLTFFDDESFKFFSYLYGLKVPKWNCAHILLGKKFKNIRKTPKNTCFTTPWLRTSLLNDPVDEV